MNQMGKQIIFDKIRKCNWSKLNALMCSGNPLKLCENIFGSVCLESWFLALMSLKGINDPATYRIGNTGVNRQTFWECCFLSFKWWGCFTDL